MPEVTLVDIQKAVEDLKTGQATKFEAIKLIETKLANDEEKLKVNDSQLKEARTAVEELNKQAKGMQAEIVGLQKNRFASIRTSDGRYKGFWPSLEMARDFGLYIIGEVLGIKSAKEMLTNRGIACQYISEKDEINTKGFGSPLVPEDFRAWLVERIGTYGVYRRNASIWPMVGGSGSFPILTGDPEVYCLDAGVAPSASSLGFGAGGLSPKKWISYIPVPRELTEDAAIAIGEVAGRRLARAFGRKEDACGFMGDGTKAYFNYIGLIAAILAVDASVANIMALRVQATPGAWSAIVGEDIQALPGLIHDDAEDGVDCKWYCNKNFFWTVMIRIALGMSGTPASEVINTAFTPNPYYFGRPVEFVPCMARVKPSADHVPLLFGNLRLAAILGEARKIDIATDSSVFFTSDSVAIRATERIGMNNQTGVGSAANASEPVEGVIVGLRADIA